MEEKMVKKIGGLIIGLALIFLWFHWAPNPPANLSSNNLAALGSADFLVIEKLNITAPIVYANNNDESAIQSALQNGVVHLPSSAAPGAVGNVYIVGHSSDYRYTRGNYKTVFARLPELAAGDKIIIRQKSGDLIYRVRKTRIVRADDLSVLDQATAGRRLLTLQTSYPVGTARQRYIVIAQQLEK